jgi:hypothetical protein
MCGSSQLNTLAAQAAAEVHRLRDFALRGDVPGMASVLQGGLAVNARDEVRAYTVHFVATNGYWLYWRAGG